MDIYTILASKSHNPHYLNRYIAFIERCQLKNVGYSGVTENHHICPKAKDMFPEYKDFQKFPWNRISLTLRQHFIAHVMLWKTYVGVYSQTLCLNLMVNNKDVKNSKLYENLRIEFLMLLEQQKPEMSARQKLIQTEKMMDGTHVFLTEEFRNESSTRMKANNPMTKNRINAGSFKKGHKPKITKERNRKISVSKLGEKNPNYGKTGSFDHINKNVFKCEYCDIETTIGNITRWHGDNCKHKQHLKICL